MALSLVGTEPVGSLTLAQGMDEESRSHRLVSVEPIHDLHRQLIEVGICRADSLEEFHPRVRDRDDVAVLRCIDSGVLMLSRLDHIDTSYYDGPDPVSVLAGLEHVIGHQSSVDAKRRGGVLAPHLEGRRWLDIGTGGGGILHLLRGLPSQLCGVEPNTECRTRLISDGFDVRASMADFADSTFDVVTMFHVFEHLLDPLGCLAQLGEIMEPGSILVIEVPSGRDILLNQLDLVEFKDFSLWSQHLVLHTRESLTAMLDHAGFAEINVRGIQRYSIGNHLHWLRYRQPGGHVRWEAFSGEPLASSYEGALALMDANDTLFATAVVR